MVRVALVTGANKGIGFEVSRQLALGGFSVLLGARDSTRGEQAAKKLREEGLDVRAVHVDLERAIETGNLLVHNIQERFGHLDTLVNNAAIADELDGPASSVPVNVLRHTFETNFFGTVAFTQLLLPLLRAAESAQIINVSSELGSLANNGDPSAPFYSAKVLAYNASKAALNMFTIGLAYDLRDTKVKVHSVCPGFTATDMNKNTGPQTVQEGAVEIVRLCQSTSDTPTGSFTNQTGSLPW